MNEPELSIVLPCYNESAGLRDLVERYRVAGRDRNFELILVDNGSTDDTRQVLAGLLPEHLFVRRVEIRQNRGYGDGILTGLKEARGELLAWSHADLQTDPGDVFRAWETCQNAVETSRVLVKGRRRGRRLGERFISRGMEMAAFLLLRSWLSEINAQPKLFHRDLLQHLVLPPIDFNFDVYVLYQARQHGWHIESIDVEFPPRPYGKSHWAATWRSKLRTIFGSIRYMFLLGLRLAR